MPAIEFEVWCSCRAGLCNQTTNVRGGIEVEPCEKCLEKAKKEGHEEGYDKGFEAGYEKGIRETN